jgi:hypothetical protein
VSAWTRARFVSLAALLPLLVLAVAGPGYDRLRCMFNGEVSEAGCCPLEEAPATPVVHAGSCCAHESARVVRLPAELAPPRADAAAAPPAVAVLTELAPVVSAVRAAPATSQEPPPTPILLAKQSFLI